jgi:hypothetical protein
MTLVDELSSGFYKKQDKSAPPLQSQVVHKIECVRADTVEQEPITWLWEYRIVQKRLWGLCRSSRYTENHCSN